MHDKGAPNMNAASPTFRPRPAAGVAQTTSALQAAATVPAMDREFIEHNQIVERYLSGRLPPRGAQDFERFCKANPDLLDQLGLADRVHSGLRLLEAGGKPEPWAPATKVWWSQLPVVAGLAAGVLALGILAIVLASSLADRSNRIAALETRLQTQPLDPATTTRPVILVPTRNGPIARPALTIGGKQTEFADFKVDVSWSKATLFRVTVDRESQGRVAVIQNLAKDSNGHLRIALNSSALGPGIYQLQMDEINWRGEAAPAAWIAFAIAR